MADETVQPEDDQNLWRAMYTTADGWSPGVAFADHLSVAAPALAEVDGTLYCVHRGAHEEAETFLPINWTSFTPASTQPFVTALEEASKPLPEGASDEQKTQWQKTRKDASDALDQARRWTPDEPIERCRSSETPAIVNDHGKLRMIFAQRGKSHGLIQSQLVEARLERWNGKLRWGSPMGIGLPDARLPLAPALAVFNEKVHLVYADADGDYIGHLVWDDDEFSWKPVTGADGEAITTPAQQHLGMDREQYKEAVEEYGWPGNLALAVHDGQLHLVYRDQPAGWGDAVKRPDGTWARTGGRLWHAAVARRAP
ncbi:hypothetical protein [Streptomyces violascens]|uniref:hypothetical protein n=1 Tax=Streptomyces violascens TaxID=67381 RepID=UPI0036A73041